VNPQKSPTKLVVFLKMKKFLFIFLIFCFSLTIISCAKKSSDDETTTDNDTHTTTDTTAPTVTSVSITADNQSSVSITDNITVTFSEAMDRTYVTTNTSDTYCSGTLRVSSDNFSSCVKMSSEPASSNSNKTFTLDPYDNLTVSTTYKIRVTTGVKDTAGNTLSSQYDNSTGFTTASADTTAPVIAEVTAVTTPTNDRTPNYTFSSTEAGTITYGGSCSSSTTSANTYNNTITFNTLDNETHSNCTIKVTDSSANVSNTIEITDFTVSSAQLGGSIQGTALSLTGEVTTFAGSSSFGATDATGTSARFYYPYGITTDGTNLYVADRGNNRIRKIVISTGVVTTLAGSGLTGSTDATGTSASFHHPEGITTDGTNLYVSDVYTSIIRKIVISTGVVTTLAGSSKGFADGTGTSARFNELHGITTDGTNLYVADVENHRIRKIAISTGVVTTLAGGNSSGSTDATGTSARFYLPHNITTDGTNLYVTDTFNHRIRKIVISTGVVTTLVGSGTQGSANGTGTEASFYKPRQIATDGTNLYVADPGNNMIRKIVISTGVVTTLAGGSSSGSTDATGTSARFNYPIGITTDGTNLYVADHNNHRIRKIE
jgi:hypothetical protein